MSLQVHDFGYRNGKQTYRVSGNREDLHKVLDECYTLEAEFYTVPKITHVRHGLWTMLLELKVGNWVG